MKTLLDLNHGECRWPIDAAEGRFFCAEPIARKSYCAHHFGVAYPPQAQKAYSLPPARKRVAETKSGETHSAPDVLPEVEAADCVEAMGGAA